MPAPCHPCDPPPVVLPFTGAALQPTGSNGIDWAPLRVTKGALAWLRFHFGEAGRIHCPQLKNLVYVPDGPDGEPTTPLVISTLAEYRPNDASRRPAVLVERGDQQLEGAAAGIGLRELGTFQLNHTVPMHGSHTVFCLAGREGEIELLAAEVLLELVGFHQQAADRLCLRRLRAPAMGRRVRLDEPFKDTWTVPIHITYDYDVRFQVTPAAPALRRAQISALDAAVNS